MTMARLGTRCLVAAALVLCTLDTGTPAQQSPAPQPPAAEAPSTSAPGDGAQALVGSWEFSNADRDKRCTITFSAEAARRGMKVDFDKGCAGLFPFITEIAGWSIAANDFLRLLDAKGEPVLEFSEVETGIYEAPRPGEGILFIQNAAAAGPAPRPPEQMAGVWDVVRGAASPPICTLTLTLTPADQDLTLSVNTGCNAFVTRFAPTTWQMDRAELVINGARGATWRFAEGDAPTTWQRVPERAEPIWLVRRP